MKVRSSSNPLSFLNNPTLFDTPRLDIDSGAVINDLRSSPDPRRFNGLNGTGTLNMTSNPAALDLTPYIDSDYNTPIQTSVRTITLNTQDLSLNSGLTVKQTLRGADVASNNTPKTYNITRGILAFPTPSAIRSGAANPVTLNVGAAGTLDLAFQQSGYDFTGGTNPSGTLNVMTGSTINLAPSSSNTAKDLTVLATTPATLRVVTYSGAAHPSPLNINLDMSKIYAGTGYIKLVSDTANIGTMLVPADLNVVSLTAGVTINNVYVDAAGDFIYIGYTSTLNPGGGGGDPDPISKDISIDMTPILNTVKSDDLFIINRVDGTSENYDLSTSQLIINADVEDVLTVKNVGSLFTITYDHSPIYSGAKIVVTLTDSQGNKTSYNTVASIINGHSILDFDALGLASGTYDIRIDSPAGSNPRYTGPVTYSYEYTAPAGAPVFSLTPSVSDRTVTAFATIAGSSPVSGVTVTFMITNSTGAVIGTAKTAVTGSDGKTPTVTFGDNLVDGTYTVTATTDNYGTKIATVTVKGSTTKKSGGSGGCDAGFGAFALLAMAGGALVLRKKG